MNTKQISDVKKGNLRADALYQGSCKLWSPHPILAGILQPENLVSLYTVSTYKKINNESLSTISTGYWTDYITQTDRAQKMSHVTSHDSATNPGVKFNSSAFSIPCSTNTKSFYVRFRVSSAKRNNGVALELLSSALYGLSMRYIKGELYIRTHDGNVTASQVIPLSINPHEYHTYAFIYNSTDVNFYVDGEWAFCYQLVQSPAKFAVYANYDSYISATIETFAAYKNTHTPDEVKSISAGINSKFRYKIIPLEEGLVLYDHGNQCESVTNGWLLNSYDSYSGTICTHDVNSINLNGYNASGVARFCSTQTANLIDFTPYTRLYFYLSTSKFPGDVTYTSDIEGAKCGYTSNTNHTSSSGRVYCAETVAAIGGKTGQTEDDAVLVCMDISDVNGMYAPIIADGTGAENGDCTRIYKVWLG